MQNNHMGYDPRCVVNTILDISDELGLAITNLSINKILFFAHRDILVSENKRLISTTFEAWKYGPVVPVVYHEFKKFNDKVITTRAKKLCRETGNRVTAVWDESELFLDCLKSIVSFYGTIPANKLVELSHEQNGPWHHVWSSKDHYLNGMTITDEIIRKHSFHKKDAKYAN